MKMFRRFAILSSSFAVAASCIAGLVPGAPKYVIMFIGDGMSVPQRMTADEFSRKAGNGPLVMNTLPVQATTRTCSANSLVTDSAAAATAIACGSKTDNGRVGIDSAGNRLESCAEVAKNAGMKVGICTTVTITHATPAGFYAHRDNRSDTYGIAIDLADSGFDFFAGGSFDVNPDRAKKHAQFAAYGDAYRYAEGKGYKIVKGKDEFMALKPGSGKIIGRLSHGALEPAIDVNAATAQPTIAEITKKAIEFLYYSNSNGFFLMVEGGRIDWAGHANDAATNLRDVLALDDAVKIALKFQNRFPDETLVVVTGDHETGGMSMGFAGTGYALYMDRLAGQTCSVGKFDSKVSALFKKNPTLKYEDVKPLVKESFGFKYRDDPGVDANDPMILHRGERGELENAFVHDLEFYKHKIGENEKYDGEKKYLFGGTCRRVISAKSGIGWSSGAHTAMPVLTTAKGCGAERFSGYLDNTDISRIIKSFYTK